MPDASAMQVAPRILSYRGIPVTEERPLGYIQRGTSEDGHPWARIYGYDRRTGEALPGFLTYGEIPGTASGDGEALDAYLGSDLDAQFAYIVEQGEPDPELKIVLGVPDVETAVLYYTAHVPEEMLRSIRAVPIELVQNLLGVTDDVVVAKCAGPDGPSAFVAKVHEARVAKALETAITFASSYAGPMVEPTLEFKHPATSAPLSGMYEAPLAAGGWRGWIVPARPEASSFAPITPAFERKVGARGFLAEDWIAFVGVDGRTLLWEERAPDGSVVGTPIVFLRPDLALPAENLRPNLAPDETVELDKRDPTTIQTLIFDREKFTAAEARAWAREHDFKAGKVDENESSVRLRQIEPDAFDESTFRTIEITGGVKAVVGVRRSVQKAIVTGEPIMKSDALRFALFPVLEPLDGSKGEADTQGDFYSEATIREGMWWFMKHHQNTMLLHIRQGGTIVNERVDLVECYQAKNDEVIEGSQIRKGTWLVGYHFPDDEIWGMLTRGEIQAVSIEGLAERVPVA